MQFQGERNIGKATSCSLMNDPGQNKSGKLGMHWRLGSWLMVLEGSSTWFHPNLPSPTMGRPKVVPTTTWWHRWSRSRGSLFNSSTRTNYILTCWSSSLLVGVKAYLDLRTWWWLWNILKYYDYSYIIISCLDISIFLWKLLSTTWFGIPYIYHISNILLPYWILLAYVNS